MALVRRPRTSAGQPPIRREIVVELLNAARAVTRSHTATYGQRARLDKACADARSHLRAGLRA